MGDGWETRRRRGPGNDWLILRLGGAAALIERIEVDTNHFKGNFPESCSLEAAALRSAASSELTSESPRLAELLPQTKLSSPPAPLLKPELAAPAPSPTCASTSFPTAA